MLRCLPLFLPLTVYVLFFPPNIALVLRQPPLLMTIDEPDRSSRCAGGSTCWRCSKACTRRTSLSPTSLPPPSSPSPLILTLTLTLVLAMFEGMHMTHPDQMFAAKSSRVVREVVVDAPGEYGPRCICYKVIIYAYISSNISAPCAHVSSVLTPFVHAFFVFASVGRCFFQAPTRSPASAMTTTTGE
jgi:hypothetical protein